MKNSFTIVVTEKMYECVSFYVKYFGFQIVFDSDWYNHLRDGKVELAFMRPGLDNQPPELHPEFCGSGVVISFEVDDAEAEFNRLVNLDAPIVVKLRTEEWGQKHFILRDPSGAYVDVVEQL